MTYELPPHAKLASDTATKTAHAVIKASTIMGAPDFTFLFLSSLAYELSLRVHNGNEVIPQVFEQVAQALRQFTVEHPSTKAH